MIFRQLIDYTSNTYTYLLASQAGGQAILIDPVLDQLDIYRQLIQELELKLAVVIDTHCHADHITASGHLRQEFGCDIAMGERTDVQGLTIPLSSDKPFTLEGMTLTPHYTPGHTNDSYSYSMKTDTEQRVFTGDALLIHATGRTDFQSGSSIDAYHSIFDCLLKMPEETLVYPAHDYKGLTVTTIGEEKRFNPRLQVSSAEEYADIMDNLNLPYPKKIDIAVPANLHCGLRRQ